MLLTNRMMIYLSVTQLLDSLGAFLCGNAGTLAFTGVDTSFNLVFRRTKDGLSVAGEDGVIARTAPQELASAVLSAAESLSRRLPSEDPAASGYEASLAAFRPLLS
ncbi:hypothetical protein [Streptomyces sp. NPDC058371]|uniref:hypothetical protein n=1 Tax=Streptomyces sp. NPDC058371 TaxID=3346463 RepID=UPI0036557D74